MSKGRKQISKGKQTNRFIVSIFWIFQKQQISKWVIVVFFGLHKVLYVSKTTTKQDIMFVFCYDNNKPKKVCIPLWIKQKL